MNNGRKRTEGGKKKRKVFLLMCSTDVHCSPFGVSAKRGRFYITGAPDALIDVNRGKSFKVICQSACRHLLETLSLVSIVLPRPPLSHLSHYISHHEGEKERKGSDCVKGGGIKRQWEGAEGGRGQGRGGGGEQPAAPEEDAEQRSPLAN